jgi:DNA replication protein DnaD
LNAYNSYLETIEKNQMLFEDEDRKKANQILISITAKKKEITEALGKVGSQSAFEDIKNYIKYFESMRPAYRERVNMYAERAKDVSERVVKAHVDSGEMVDGFFAENNLISILQLIYGEYK